MLVSGTHSKFDKCSEEVQCNVVVAAEWLVRTWSAECYTFKENGTVQLRKEKLLEFETLLGVWDMVSQSRTNRKCSIRSSSRTWHNKPNNSTLVAIKKPPEQAMNTQRSCIPLWREKSWGELSDPRHAGCKTRSWTKMRWRFLALIR